MPELPEVETIARGLRLLLACRTIVAVPYAADHLVSNGVNRLRRELIGKHIRDVSRRGKLLFLDFQDDARLAFHLRMTGRLGVLPSVTLSPASSRDQPGTSRDKHAHLLLDLDDQTTLYFQDQRKFGTCRYFSGEELAAWPFYRDLGPEPLELGVSDFQERIRGKKGRIKALLLDQKFIAGIGNIYADESLFRASIHPATPADRISPQRLERLLVSIREVLTEALAASGSSIRDYRTAAGLVGTFQNNFFVYGCKGQPCKRCGNPLRTAKIAGRTTCFCPACQKA